MNSNRQKPTFNLVRTDNIGTTNMKGGNYPSRDVDPDGFYRYKAEKYHYKCQRKVREIMNQGKPCPAGYETYLQPFRG